MAAKKKGGHCCIHDRIDPKQLARIALECEREFDDPRWNPEEIQKLFTDELLAGVPF